MTNSRELLSAVLEGFLITPLDIGEFLRTRPPEDQWLDFKSGNVLKKPKAERAFYVRRMVSAFANADGGLLVLGVRDPEHEDPGLRWTIDGCDPKDVNEDLVVWTQRALAALAPHLYPPPRVQVVACEDGIVVLVGVERAARIVPVRDGSEVRHFLRVGEESLPMPPYLYTDLVLGRRERPSFEVSASVAALELGETDVLQRGETAQFHLVVRVENSGVVWVPNARLGVVAYVTPLTLVHLARFEVSSSPWRTSHGPLARSVDIVPLDALSTGANVLASAGFDLAAGGKSGIPPLEFVEIEVPVSCHRLNVPTRWRAALVLTTPNGEPEWYQLGATIDWSAGHKDVADVACERCHGARPTVSWAAAAR